jgi:putative glutamine amidotransferase
VNAHHPGRPVIGISAHTGPARIAIFDMRITFVAQVFLDRVITAGAIPVLLPPLADPRHLTERLDGLLMLAGPDIDPARYGQPRHPMTRFDSVRDTAELALLDAAVRTGLPFLGICRGLQLLNVLRGGTLHQHLPDLIGHDRHSPGDGVYGSQKVRLAAGSRIAAAMSDTALVSCHHHQAVDRLGDGLTSTAWSEEDGIVEAVELADHPFGVGVEWHAEQDPDDGPFLAMVAAAREHRRHD